jgi:hypothetical protein
LNNFSCRAALLILLVPGVVPAEGFFREGIITEPVPTLFSICFDHSCTTVVGVSLTPQEWRHATQPLQPPAQSAAGERSAIACAIARFEEIVGRHTGTSDDRGRNLRGFGQPGQLDCIDESTNTTTYLRLLERNGLLQHHVVVDRVTRFGLSAGMPHTTAVIQERATGARFAVDSWFFDNGEPAYIVDLAAWSSGEDPDKQLNACAPLRTVRP